MYKQIIVVNKSLNMSPGKLAAMVAHGSISFITEWIRHNIRTDCATSTEYAIDMRARVDRELYAEWICGNFTKIILEVKNEKELKEIVKKAHEYGMINRRDFFNIVDESTEFKDIPRWAVVAFKPMENRVIDKITGNLNLYGYTDKNDINWLKGKHKCSGKAKKKRNQKKR